MAAPVSGQPPTGNNINSTAGKFVGVWAAWFRDFYLNVTEGLAAITTAYIAADTALNNALDARLDILEAYDAVRQRVSTQTGAVATGATAMPLDDTIPQITEGNEFMTLSITPQSASSILVIEARAQVSHSVTGTLIAALFQDATADALQATSTAPSAVNTNEGLLLKYVMTSGTTSSTTFRVRASGGGAGATTTFNGTAGGRIFGGVYNSYMHITEYKT